MGISICASALKRNGDYFSRFISEFSDVIVSVLDDMSINSESSVMTLSILRFDSSAQFLKGIN